MQHQVEFINMVYSLNRGIIITKYIYSFRIKKYDLVIEYKGEIIRNSLADEREKSYI